MCDDDLISPPQSISDEIMSLFVILNEGMHQTLNHLYNMSPWSLQKSVHQKHPKRFDILEQTERCPCVIKRELSLFA